VVSGNGVDRLLEALEGEVKLAFVIAHGAIWINHVRGNHQEFHVGPFAEEQTLIAERMLGGAAVAVIGDHDEAEIAVTDSLRFHAKEAVTGNVRVMPLKGADHVLAPGVGPGFGPAMPYAGGPGFGIEEVIVIAPQGIDGDKDRNDRQTGTQAPSECIAG